MIVLAVGKKGSGKTAFIRKLSHQAVSQRSPVFFHDPQAQINASAGRVYTSAAAWARDTSPPFLSIFRGCTPEDVAALALAVKDVTLVIDEMDQACYQKRWIAPSVRKIVHEGRHYRVCLFGSFRRTANVSEDLVSQCDVVALFRTTPTSPYDLQAIAQRFGDDYAEAVQGLDVGQFVLWTDE